MIQDKPFYTEIYNRDTCDTDYRYSKEFMTYQAACNHARKVYSLLQDTDKYDIYVYNKSRSTTIREDWSLGRHSVLDDAIL